MGAGVRIGRRLDVSTCEGGGGKKEELGGLTALPVARAYKGRRVFPNARHPTRRTGRGEAVEAGLSGAGHEDGKGCEHE